MEATVVLIRAGVSVPAAYRMIASALDYVAIISEAELLVKKRPRVMATMCVQGVIKAEWSSGGLRSASIYCDTELGVSEVIEDVHQLYGCMMCKMELDSLFVNLKKSSVISV